MDIKNRPVWLLAIFIPHCLQRSFLLLLHKHKQSATKTNGKENELKSGVPQSKGIQVIDQIRLKVEKLSFDVTGFTIVEGRRFVNSWLSKHHHGITELWDPWGMLLWRWSAVVVVLNRIKSNLDISIIVHERLIYLRYIIRWNRVRTNGKWLIEEIRKTQRERHKSLFFAELVSDLSEPGNPFVSLYLHMLSLP